MSDEDTPPEGLRLETETIPPPTPHLRSSSIIFRTSMYVSLFFVCAAIMLLLASRLLGTGRDHAPRTRLDLVVTPVPPSPSATDAGVALIDHPTPTDHPPHDPAVPAADSGVLQVDTSRSDRPRRPVVRRRRCPPPVIMNGVIVSSPCES